MYILSVQRFNDRNFILFISSCSRRSALVSNRKHFLCDFVGCIGSMFLHFQLNTQQNNREKRKNKTKVKTEDEHKMNTSEDKKQNYIIALRRSAKYI